MSIKITIPNSSSDVLTFGSGNTPTAAQIAGIDSGSSNGQLALYTTASGTSTERVRVDASGNVGIGTSSPTVGLQVDTGSDSRIRLSNSNTVVGQLQATSSAFSVAAVGGSVPLTFYTNGSERARIDTAGRLLVGTTSLVSGFSAISTIVSATNTSSNITLKDTGTTYGTGTQYISFVNSSNAGAGSIQHTAVTTVAYATTSDLRLKENITDCPSALNIAQQIKVRSYNWKEDGRHVDYGFVAQELNHFFPDAVCQGDDSEEILDPKQTWQVDYGKITPLLLKAIQEQQAIIQTLTDRVSALDERLTALENK